MIIKSLKSMNKSRILNLIDLIRFKKDFIWGKDYFAKIENGKVTSSILFSRYLASKKVLEIHEFDSQETELLKDFLNYSTKKKYQYIISKLCESTQINEIEMLRANGFLRLTREYTFNYKDFKTISLDTIPVICDQANKKKVKDLVHLCKNAQPLEFRDYLFHSPKFFKERLDDTYIFYAPKNMEQPLGCAYKLEPEKDLFEFVIPLNQSENFLSFLLVFVDKFIHFEKNESFSFIVNENIDESIIKQLEGKFELESSKQVLIHKTLAKDKVKVLEKLGNKIQIPVTNGQVTNRSKSIHRGELRD